MKKILALMLALVLGFAFTSCEKADDSNSTKIIGKWLLYKVIDSDGADVTDGTIMNAHQFLVFNTGGKGAIRLEREGMSLEIPFDWVIEGNTVTLSSEQMESDSVLEIVSLTSKELVIEQEGEISYLKKV